jgi:hypothetical protein
MKPHENHIKVSLGQAHVYATYMNERVQGVAFKVQMAACVWTETFGNDVAWRSFSERTQIKK